MMVSVPRFEVFMPYIIIHYAIECGTMSKFVINNNFLGLMSLIIYSAFIVF